MTGRNETCSGGGTTDAEHLGVWGRLCFKDGAALVGTWKVFSRVDDTGQEKNANV